MLAKLGKREQKRQETRQRLAQVARQLFLAQGFDCTTVDEIAAQAGIARRTFFHYFASKEDVIFSLYDDFEHTLTVAIRDAPPQNSILGLAKYTITTALGAIDPQVSRDIEQLKHDAPILRGRDQGKQQWLEKTVGDALAARMSIAPDDLRTRLDAVLIAGVLRVALEGWGEAMDTGASAQDHVHKIISVLEAGLTPSPGTSNGTLP